MIYRSFAMGCLVSALTISAAWGTWTAFKPSGAADDVIKANGRVEVARIEIATKFPGARAGRAGAGRRHGQGW